MAERIKPTTFPASETQTITIDEVDNKPEVFEDPHVKDIELVKEVKLNEKKSLRLVGPPVEFSDLKNSIRLPPPELGEHTKDVLKNYLNYSDEKIEILMKKGAVQ